MSKIYVYYVSYFHRTDSVTGFGYMEIKSPNKFTTFQDLKESKELIDKNSKGQESIILNFILLRVERVWWWS